MEKNRKSLALEKAGIEGTIVNRFGVFLGVGLISTFAVLLRVMAQRSEIGSSLFLGYSASRLALIAALGVFFLLETALSLSVWRSALTRARLIRRLESVRSGLRTGMIFGFFVVSGWMLAYVYWLPDAAPALVARFLPVAFWLVFRFLWTAGYCSVMFEGVRFDSARIGKRFINGALPFALCAIAVLIVFLPPLIGLEADSFDWQPPGMAIHWGQLLTASVAGSALTWLLCGLKKALPSRFSEAGRRRFAAAVGFAAVWAVAAALWISVPSDAVLKNSYFMEIAQPGGVPYPASDAAYFGVWAESILAGLGLKDAVISRQLFVWYLSLLFRIAGQDWYLTIDLLTATLALIPALLFLLGTQLSGFGAGAVAAGIAVCRELNTLYMAPFFGVSSSKMFLSDLPMLLALSAAMNAAVWALRANRESASWRRWTISGGVLGLSLLIRSQAIVILPVLALALISRKALSRRAKVSALMALIVSAALVLAPALIRSLRLTGSVGLEDTSIHGFELTRRYSGDPDYEPLRIPGEPAADFALRMRSETIAFALNRPAETAGFVLNHWTKALSESAFVLPFGLDYGLSWRERTDAAYQDLPARWRRASVWEIAGLTALIVLGLFSARRRGGFLPGAVCAVYLLSSALGRYSGWRFNLPADWFVYLYAAIGIASVGEGLLRALRITSEAGEDEAAEPTFWSRSRFVPVFLIAALTAVGALPALSGAFRADQIRPLAEDASAAEAAAWLEARGYDAASVAAKLTAAEEIRVGRMLYPRWFYADEGMTSANPWAAYRPRSFNRLGFVLLNRENVDVVAPLAEMPVFAPHRADCLAAGSRADDGVLIADAVICPTAGLAMFAER